jgi:hypothetical protein
MPADDVHLPALSDFAPVELRPNRARAVAWSVVAALVMLAAAWFLADAGSRLFAIGFLLVAAVPFVFFGTQLFAPDQFTVRLEPDELEIQQFWRHRTIAWEHVQQARVVRSGGEPALQVFAPADGGHITVVLPLGADVDALHRFLKARLGVTPVDPAT